jgi:hypothetical protein
MTSASMASAAVDDVTNFQMAFIAETFTRQLQKFDNNGLTKAKELTQVYKRQIDRLSQDIKTREAGCCLRECTNDVFLGIGLTAVVTGVLGVSFKIVYDFTANLPSECDSAADNPWSVTSIACQIANVGCTAATAFFLNTKRAVKGGINNAKRQITEYELADTKLALEQAALRQWMSDFERLLDDSKKIGSGKLKSDQVEATTKAFKKCIASFQKLPETLKGGMQDSDIVLAAAQKLPKGHPLNKAARRVSNFVLNHHKSGEVSRNVAGAEESEKEMSPRTKRYHAAIAELESAGGEKFKTVMVNDTRYEAGSGEPSVVRPSVFVPQLEDDSDDDDEPADGVSVSAAGLELSRTAGSPTATHGTSNALGKRGAASGSARPSVSAAAASLSGVTVSDVDGKATDLLTKGFIVVEVDE